MLAGIQRLAAAVGTRNGVHRLGGVITVQTSLRSASPHQPVAFVEHLVAEECADAPAVDIFHSAREELVDLLVAGLHPQQDRGLVLEREVLEFEAATGAYPDAGQLRPDRLVLSRCWHILQRGRQVLEEIGLDTLRGGRHESDLRCSGWRGLMEESGQRLDLVTRLQLLDIWHVSRIEQLGADQCQCERGR
ncbi:hypothetical protein D3C86_869590 [compost metagenome]